MTPIEVALSYVGQTEKPANSGFNGEEFEGKMRDVGWQKSQAWCAYFAELVFKEALPGKKLVLEALFNASAVQTFRNFEKAGYKVSIDPIPGALVIWQKFSNGVAQWQGHAGVCVSRSVDRKTFHSVEGNTNDKGGREGYIVAELPHRVNYDTETGLRLLGFVVIE